MTPCEATHPTLPGTCVLPDGHEGWHRDRLSKKHTEWGPDAERADKAHGKRRRRGKA